MPNRSRNKVPVDVGFNRVILEPITKIMGFGNIEWEIKKVVNGAVYSLLYGEDRTHKEFYKSPIAAKNTEIMAQTALQLYSYLDTVISQFAKIEDYVFRIKMRITVDKTKGSIIGEPLFEVEIYKHVGKVSAKGPGITRKIPVMFIGREDDKLISPDFLKMIRRAVNVFNSITLSTYPSVDSAPNPFKAKVIENHPTLFLEKKAFPVKLKVSKDGSNSVYIDNGDEFTISEDRDLIAFLSEQLDLQPEISRENTAFESPKKMSREIREISDKLREVSTESDEEEDFLKSLKIEKLIDRLSTTVSSLKKASNDGKEDPAIKELEQIIEAASGDYGKLKVDYEVSCEQLKDIEKKFTKRQVTYDQYSVEKWRTVTGRNTAQQDLIKLQTKVKKDIFVKVTNLKKKS